jgi:hypothetical protein
MAKKGKTRGPDENKHVKESQKQEAKYNTREKREEKQIGSKKQ